MPAATITAIFQQKLATGLQTRRDFVLPLFNEQPREDETAFELVTWPVLHDGTPGGCMTPLDQTRRNRRV